MYRESFPSKIKKALLSSNNVTGEIHMHLIVIFFLALLWCLVTSQRIPHKNLLKFPISLNLAPTCHFHTW